jgi:hypothetical protein
MVRWVVLVWWAWSQAAAAPCLPAERGALALAPDGRSVAVVAAGAVWAGEPLRPIMPVQAVAATRLVFGDDGILLIWDSDALWSTDLKTPPVRRLEGSALAPALARVRGRTGVVLDQGPALAEKDFEFKRFECSTAAWRNAIDLTGAPRMALGHANDCGDPEGMVLATLRHETPPPGLTLTPGPSDLADLLGASAGWFHASQWVVTTEPGGGHHALIALRPGPKKVQRVVLGRFGTLGPFGVAPDQQSAVVWADGAVVRLEGDRAPRRLPGPSGLVTALATSGSTQAALTEAGLVHSTAEGGWRVVLEACSPPASDPK